jgi:hypothetical protein
MHFHPDNCTYSNTYILKVSILVFWDLIYGPIGISDIVWSDLRLLQGISISTATVSTETLTEKFSG